MHRGCCVMDVGGITCRISGVKTRTSSHIIAVPGVRCSTRLESYAVRPLSSSRPLSRMEVPLHATGRSCKIPSFQCVSYFSSPVFCADGQNHKTRSRKQVCRILFGLMSPCFARSACFKHKIISIDTQHPAPVRYN